MTFIDNLKNIQPLDFNQTVINNSDALVINTINNANDLTGGLWFIIVILALFIWLNYVLFDRQAEFKYDLARTMFISSSWCLSLSVVAALTGFSTTILPIIWFSTIFFISGIGVLQRKEKNI